MFASFFYLSCALVASTTAGDQQQFPQFQQWTPYGMADAQQQMQLYGQQQGDQQENLLSAAAQQHYPQFAQWAQYGAGVPSTERQQLQQYWQYSQPNADQQFQPSDYSGGYHFSGISDSSGYGHVSGDDGSHGFGGHDLKAHVYPVHQHVEEENPEPIKHYKEVVVPIPKNVEFKVNHPVLIPVPHPVPIQIPVPKAVVIPIIKEVSIPVEKSVPYPVEKIVHVPKIKEVPFEVVKHIIVPVDKPVPFKVPVYETIIHTKKGSHKI